jgi:hypothetical protein
MQCIVVHPYGHQNIVLHSILYCLNIGMAMGKLLEMVNRLLFPVVMCNMVSGEWPLVTRTRHSESVLRREPLIGPISQLGDADTSTLKGPAPDRTTRHRARGRAWRNLTREGGRVGREPLEWIPRPAPDWLAINSRPHLRAPRGGVNRWSCKT